MFNGTKIISQSVQDAVPLWLQNVIWYVLETMDIPVQSAVQSFRLTSQPKTDDPRSYHLTVLHCQQHPYYRKEHALTAPRPVTAHILVIDNPPHCFMLLC
ncbi:DUF960 family protein [Paenibacillus sp. YN15]|uniref:DUF960 family protein n=1 Tax=Paenibacillus sp. YN15 TaxID=1742774 RepID=UPI000DCC37E0|nr:hypothetical protein DQG13_29990 [Paenibacillus sp. YN15]